MPYGNVSGKKAKGYYISDFKVELLNQCMLVEGKSASSVLEDAILEHWLAMKARLDAANISLEMYLQSKKHWVPEWQRSKKI